MKSVGKFNWTYLTSVDSTNEYAKRLDVHNAVVLAARQTAGKGRDGRRFESQTGGLYMSVVRKDGLTVQECAKYYLAAPLAVVAALGKWGVVAQIKWPNDVWVGHKKIAGVLVETVWQEGIVQKAVVGIGVNVRNQLDRVPCAATSMKEEGAHSTPRKLAAEIAQRLDDYMRLSVSELVSAVKNKLLTLGKTVTFCDGREGVAGDISPDGRLVVRVCDRQVYVAAGDVTIKE